MRVQSTGELDAADLDLIGPTVGPIACVGERRAELVVLDQLIEAGDLIVEALDGRAAEAEVEVVADLVRRREVLVAQDARRHAAVVAAEYRRTVEARVGESD